MSLWKKIAGTVLSSFGIGAGQPGDKTLVADTGAATPPALRWNDTSKQWEFSNDGTTWQTFDSSTDHKTLRQLIHFVETNSPGDGFGVGPYYRESNYLNNIYPTNETWYETSAKLKKICRWEATYLANKSWDTETWIIYQTDGVSPAAMAVDTITYVNNSESSRSRAVTVY